MNRSKGARSYANVVMTPRITSESTARVPAIQNSVLARLSNGPANVNPPLVNDSAINRPVLTMPNNIPLRGA